MTALSTQMLRAGARTFLARAQTTVQGGAICSLQRVTSHARFVAPLACSARERFLSSRPYKSPYDKEETLIPGYDKFGSLVSQNITHNSFALPHRDGKVPYEEDYDEYNLHTTPASITSQDSEQLSELEMIRYDDVGDLASESFLFYDENEGDEYEGSGDTEDGGEYYEFEEDWEMLHRQNSGNAGPCQVLDEIDDVNDVII